jgi:hypothetical protein
MRMTRKNLSLLWWAVALCVVGIAVVFVLRSGRSPDSAPPRDGGDDPSLPEGIRILGMIRAEDSESGNPVGSEATDTSSPTVRNSAGVTMVPSEGSFPIRYVDGPVIFQDGFERGLGSWQASILRLSAEGEGILSESRKGAERATIRETDVRGARSRVAVVECTEAGFCAALVPVKPVPTGDFSLTSDVYVGPSTGLSCMIFSTERAEVVFRDSTFQFPALRWSRARGEVLILRDEKSVDYFDVKFFVNDKLTDHQRHYGGRVIPGFVIENGTVTIDNVAIRQMVPKDAD